MSDEDDWGDDDGFDDDGFDDDGDDDWGDINDDPDEIMIDSSMNNKKKPPTKEEIEEQNKLKNAEWRCLECNHMNKGQGMLCFNCNKPNLGELDRRKRVEEEKECAFWFDHYENVYPTLHLYNSSKLDSMLDKQLVLKIVKSIYAKQGFDNKWPDIRKWKEKDKKTKCESCTLEFCNDEEKELSNNSEYVRREELTCHCNICRTCFKLWIRSKLSTEDILPHIRCPGEDCDYSIPYLNFVEHFKLSVHDFYLFCSIYCEKMLRRNNNWIPCPTSKCKYGFVLSTAENEKTAVCDVCDTKHTVKREQQQDEGFKQLLKEGKIRLCPKCQYPHMKDYGLCNVLQCGKCKIWWNWRTRDMAQTNKQLKDKARRNKTLWEPGELEWQQKLERENLPEFIAFLERNGIKYDPNYRRGR